MRIVELFDIKMDIDQTLERETLQRFYLVIWYISEQKNQVGASGDFTSYILGFIKNSTILKGINMG